MPERMSDVHTLQKGGCLPPSPFGLTPREYFGPVSYTHLDVYKRQGQVHRFGFLQRVAALALAKVAACHLRLPRHRIDELNDARSGNALPDACLLYTSRCV